LPQVRELTGNYPDLCELWFDTPLYIPPEISFEFYRCVYERQPRALVSERIGNGMGDILIPGDNTIPDKVQRLPWECIATTNNSWGYNCYDNDWKSPREILFWLISAAVRGGNLLLNLGPLPSGVLPPDAVKSISIVGKWLEINGDAIYDTVPWQVTHEGPTEVMISSTEQRKEDGFTAAFSPEDLFFTCKASRVFAISLVPFDKDRIVIRSLAGYPVASVRLPGSEVSVDWELRAAGLAVKRPDNFHSHELGYVVEIKLKSE
jgi:alpha-L-fucosidase